MVTEAKETMNKVFETFNDGFRSAVDATQRTQESWMKVAQENWSRPADFDRFFTRGERMMKEWGPFVGRTMDTFAQTCNTNFRAGMDMFKTCCDAATRTDENDLYKKTRQVCDASFDAMRTSFDALGKAGTKTVETCSTFCETAFADDTPGKPAAKPSKPGA